MQTFSPGPTLLPLLPGARAPVQNLTGRDVFLEVFQGRLAARLASRDLSLTQPGKPGPPGQAGKLASGKFLQGWGAGAGKADMAQAASRGGAAAGQPLPALLQQLMTLVQSQPEQSLKIPPGGALQLAAFLQAAGLPPAEVERLLSAVAFKEQGLSLADLQAAWQQAQGTTITPAAPQVGGRSGKSAAATPGSPASGRNFNDPGRWERLTVPPEQLATLRLALMNLGASPGDLAALENGGGSDGLPLARVWQIIQASRRDQTPGGSSQAGQLSGENLTTSELVDSRPVSGEDLAAWRQVLLQAGLQPEVAASLVGQGSAVSQGELKNRLLAAASPDKTPEALANPKPLYLPPSLRLRTSSRQGREPEHLLRSPALQDKAPAAAERQEPWTAPTPDSRDAAAKGHHLQRLGENLSLPASQIPALRVALMNLGASPADLAALEIGGGSDGLPLARVWQLIQEIQGKTGGPEVNGALPPAPENVLGLAGAAIAPSAVWEGTAGRGPRLGQQEVSATMAKVPEPAAGEGLAAAAPGEASSPAGPAATEAGSDPSLSARFRQQLLRVPPQAAAPALGGDNRPVQGESLAAPNWLRATPVISQETAAWRQALIQAGLRPEVVERLLNGLSPASQEDFKANFTNLAIADSTSPAPTDPKPVYLPENLRLGSLAWQGRTQEDQAGAGGSQERRSDGAGGGMHNFSAAAPAAASGAAGPPPVFAPDLQAVAPHWAANGGAWTAPGETWRFIPSEVRQSLWSQLHTGITTNLSPGESQVSLSLNPPDLGQIQLTLRLTGQELAVTAVASRPEVAELATLGAQQLLHLLAEQGLVLTHFQVQVKETPRLQPTSTLSASRQKDGGRAASDPHGRRGGGVDRLV